MNENKSLSGIVTGGCVEVEGIVMIVVGIVVYISESWMMCLEEREKWGWVRYMYLYSPSSLGVPCDRQYALVANHVTRQHLDHDKRSGGSRNLLGKRILY